MTSARPVVLCVDDERPILAALSRLLREEPYDLITTHRPEQALQWAGERDVDVLLLDQRMPGMTGTELAEAVRRDSPSVSTVMLTAYPDARTVTRYTEGLIGRMITKPWNDHALKRAVLDAVREGRQAKSGERRDTRELIQAISLERRSPADILSAVGSFLQFAGTIRSDALLLLRNIRELEGSIPDFLFRLADAVASSGVRVSVADPTGMARAFLDVEPELHSLSVYGPGNRASRQRVLIVEPLGITREHLRELARCEGHDSRTARTASEAMQAIEQEPFDVVVLDLPRPEGLPVLNRLATEPRRPRVVLLSDPRTSWDEADCGEADRLISKPYRIDDVLEALRP